MSRAEEITSEVRRLVLTCRAMEAQLQQSIPKKDHEEVVSKMQTTIDELDGEVNSMREDLQRTKGITETINALGAQIAIQKETLDFQGQTIANQTKIIDTQNKTIESLVEKLSSDTVPTTMYNVAMFKTHELEEKLSQYVAKSDFETVQQKVSDLTETLRTMIPKSEYEALQSSLSNYVPKSDFDNLHEQFSNYVPKDSFEEIKNSLTHSVPREQFLATEARIQEIEAKYSGYIPREEMAMVETKVSELESKLSESVPKSLYDELNNQMALFSQKAQEIQATAVEIAAESSVISASPASVEETPVSEVFVETVESIEVPQIVPEIVQAVSEPQIESGQIVTQSEVEVLQITPEPLVEMVQTTSESLVETIQTPSDSQVESIPRTVQDLTSEVTIADVAAVNVEQANGLEHTNVQSDSQGDSSVVSEVSSPEVQLSLEVATVVQSESESETSSPEIGVESSAIAAENFIPEVAQSETTVDVANETTTESLPKGIEETPSPVTEIFSQAEIDTTNSEPVQLEHVEVITSIETAMSPEASIEVPVAEVPVAEVPVIEAPSVEGVPFVTSEPIQDAEPSLSVEAPVDMQVSPVESETFTQVIEVATIKSIAQDSPVHESSPDAETSFADTSAELTAETATVQVAEAPTEVTAPIEVVSQVEENAHVVAAQELTAPVELTSPELTTPVEVAAPLEVATPELTTPVELAAPEVASAVETIVSIEVASPQENITQVEVPAPAEVVASLEFAPVVVIAPTEVVLQVDTSAPTEAVISAEKALVQTSVETDPAQISLTSFVTESAPTAVTESAPTAVTESAPTAVTESAPTAVTESAPTAVTESAPTAVTESAPTAVTETSVPQVVEPVPIFQTEKVAPTSSLLETQAVTIAVPALVEEKPEIREVQSQLSEIKSAEDAGATVFTPALTVVDYSMGFIFRNTGFCARSGLEFVQDLEQVPIEILQTHLRNGDFEKWFIDVLSDTGSAESIRQIRETGSDGEDLRMKVVAVIAPKYKRS